MKAPPLNMQPVWPTMSATLNDRGEASNVCVSVVLPEIRSMVSQAARDTVSVFGYSENSVGILGTGMVLSPFLCRS